MQYALIQTEPEPVDVERLSRAFTCHSAMALAEETD